jgi:hypothetical protein
MEKLIPQVEFLPIYAVIAYNIFITALMFFQLRKKNKFFKEIDTVAFVIVFMFNMLIPEYAIHGKLLNFIIYSSSAMALYYTGISTGKIPIIPSEKFGEG